MRYQNDISWFEPARVLHGTTAGGSIMRRTSSSKKLGVKERKIDRIDPTVEVRELKEQELRGISGGSDGDIIRCCTA